MMSYPRDSGCGPTSLGFREGDVWWEGMEEHEVAAKEKVACDRCRHRKIKCNRINPCAHCIKSGTQCTFRLGRKAKEKRQRVLISSVYERRLEHISNKIDRLGDIIGQLRDERGSSIWPVQPLVQPNDNEVRYDSMHQAEGIESALVSHIISATRILQTTVMGDQCSNVAVELAPALDALWSTVNFQKQQNQALEGSCPFPKVLPPGLTVRDLPIPSIDKIMACLRIAQESSPSQLCWPFEFGSLGDFTQYVVKACSPGPITDMELIIVHYVLQWLFTASSICASDEGARQDYESQALICRDSLETILSNLSFHMNTNIDSISALYMAVCLIIRYSSSFSLV
ncbi:hypothetical protein BJX63DRAFT_224664 [Aspergillus granulosus]|uniref:Zn(2)-C6 fungal-type domain-containing protein n=1 Tax=Aspergillus granulosus TaxID=176169 RepID=A0ABR4HF42_9EURO